MFYIHILLIFFNNIHFYILYMLDHNFEPNNTRSLFLRYSYYAFRTTFYVSGINFRDPAFKQKYYFNRYRMHITKWYIDDKDRKWNLVLFS